MPYQKDALRDMSSEIRYAVAVPGLFIAYKCVPMAHLGMIRQFGLISDGKHGNATTLLDIKSKYRQHNYLDSGRQYFSCTYEGADYFKRDGATDSVILRLEIPRAIANNNVVIMGSAENCSISVTIPSQYIKVCKTETDFVDLDTVQVGGKTSFDTLTVKALQARCKSRHIRYSGLRKSELLIALRKK